MNNTHTGLLCSSSVFVLLQEAFPVEGEVVEESLSQSVPMDQVSESMQPSESQLSAQDSSDEHRHDVIIIETDTDSEDEEEEVEEEPGQV